ncbi:MAG: acyl carrier protein [Myxococcaceae bacterium]|nr:acyl carrier protein [Myxococcaceae bacterium]
MSEAELLTRIAAILNGNPDLALRGPVATLAMETRFREELGLDSVALMALAFELMELAPALDERTIVQWKTAGDCVRAVTAALAARPP